MLFNQDFSILTQTQKISLTSSDSEDDVFDDPSIIEVSIGGTRRFKRSGAIRMQNNERYGVDTFVQGTVVQGTLVHEDFWPRRHWSKESFVQDESLKH